LWPTFSGEILRQETTAGYRYNTGEAQETSAGDKRRRQAQEGREQKTFKKKKKYLYTWNTVQRVETHQNTVVQRVQPAGQTIFKSNQK